MASGPDLFVVCKHCGAEVSPYITECPYCGNRIQKRAPKLDRDGQIAEKTRRRPPSPSLPRLRRGEMPGIRHDAHPYGTTLLVGLAILGTVLWRTGAVNYFQVVAYGNHFPRVHFQSTHVGLFGPLSSHFWRVFTAPFIYANTGYTVITIGVVALFGTLLERRHGPFLVIALFLLGGAAGTAVAIQASQNLVDGANGAALALIVAWAIPDLLELLGGEEPDGDIIGVAVIAAVIAVMPLVAPEASWVADGVGIVAGVLVGYPVARLHPV